MGGVLQLSRPSFRRHPVKFVRPVFRTPSDSSSRATSGVAAGCTSRRRNAHVTESRVVLYRWHPWHGREVLVFGAVRKGQQVVLRCALELADLARPLEVPQWMFDAATCCRTTLAAQPNVSIGALSELSALLRAVTAAPGSTVLKAEHLSQPDAGGGAHATREGATLARSDDAVRAKTNDSALDEFPGRDTRTHVAAPRPASPTASSRAARRAGGAR